MKQLFIVLMILVVSASGVFAQGGMINPYWDAAGTNCLLTPVAGLCYTYIFHEGVAKANASQWVLNVDAGFIATYIAYSTAPYLNILSQPAAAPPLNSPIGGISIAYGNPTCEPLPALICTMTWFCTGAEAQCSGLHVVADPLATIPAVEVRDCANVAVPGAGGTAFVDNGSGGCPTCAPQPPVTEQTWGGIKALYR